MSTLREEVEVALIERERAAQGHHLNCRCLLQTCEQTHNEAIYHPQGHWIVRDPRCAPLPGEETHADYTYGCVWTDLYDRRLARRFRGKRPMSSARERLTTLLYGPMMSVRPEQRILISGIVEACAAVADEEPELPGDPPSEAIAFAVANPAEGMRAAVRATKKSIAKSIRACLKEAEDAR